MRNSNACRRIDHENSKPKFVRYDKRRERQINKSSMVSHLIVAKSVIGFREAARLMTIAAETGTKIRLTKGKTSGSTDSIISLMKLAIEAGTPVVISIYGADEEKVDLAYDESVAVFDEERLKGF